MFNKKLKVCKESGKTLLEKWDEDLKKREEENCNFTTLSSRFKPILEKNVDYFKSCYIKPYEIFLYLKDNDKIPPDFFCDVSKIGLFAIYEQSSSSYGFGGNTDIKITIKLNKA